jgi:hypothetical protein
MRLDERAHVLVLVVHHIASDGWSMGVLVRDLATAYGATLRGEAPPWSPLDVQYADWAAWQRAWLEGGETDRQLGFWRRELAGLPPARPADGPAAARASDPGRSVDRRRPSPPALTARLARAARAEGATLHMALLAVFAAVLSRWSGQRTSGSERRSRGERAKKTEPLVGFFVNSSRRARAARGTASARRRKRSALVPEAPRPHPRGRARRLTPIRTSRSSASSRSCSPSATSPVRRSSR